MLESLCQSRTLVAFRHLHYPQPSQLGEPCCCALCVLKMMHLVRHALIKQTKFICVENILKRVSEKNGWQCSFKLWSGHFFSNRLDLTRNSFKRYTIPTEKRNENCYNVYHKPYQPLIIRFFLTLLFKISEQKIWPL